MTSLADDHLVEEPRERRGFSFKGMFQALGLSRGLGSFKMMGMTQLFYLRSSTLARRIIMFNLVALSTLLIGMLYLNQFNGGLVEQKQQSMAVDAKLYADLVSERMATAETTAGSDLLAGLPVSEGIVVRIFNPDGAIDSELLGPVNAFDDRGIMGWFSGAVHWTLKYRQSFGADKPAGEGVLAAQMIAPALDGQTTTTRVNTRNGEALVAASTPILEASGVSSALVITTQPGYLDGLMRAEQEAVLRLFALALVVSIVLSLVLASTIATPIHNLARAAEAGSTQKSRQETPERVRIPDLTGRPDEIGHLSRAMRDMTSALYDRIDTNEEFAADVAHEIKNPLASLRSAVETLRVAPEGEGRQRLLDVIEHDVRRLDRLVSDISNASRLDAELVKEELEPFDLTLMIERIADFHTPEAKDKGVELIWDAPDEPIMYDGLEGRLAQVFVNLISNAISFCGDGDAVRVWARAKDNRVLIVVEDTGPGIPEMALHKVFKRFYSERPENDYGNNSGLGLSISKQIVEAHKGVIWAENIYTQDSEDDADPLGARFVVGLPV